MNASLAAMNAREIAAARAAEQARRFPDFLISPLDVEALEPRDAALAAAIDHAVMRRWLTLAAVIESRLARPWVELEAKMQAVLLVGAAQLLLLERLPDHAVINEAVEWAKRRIRPKAGGMVNAVLRKIAALRTEMTPPRNQGSYDRDELPLHDGRVWRLTEPIFAEQPLRRIAQQTSHPEELLSRWTEEFGHDAAFQLARHSLVFPPIILHDDSGSAADPSAANPSAANHQSNAEHPLVVPHHQNGFCIFTGSRAQLAEFLVQHPGTIVQDPTSAAPIRATQELNPKPRLIIDACAGRGTKTRQLAQLHPDVAIVATDIAADRVNFLRQQFAGHNQVSVIDFKSLSEYHGRADLLVLDVPCSNTGVLARRVEAKYRCTPRQIQKTVELQRQVVADSLNLLSDSGWLAYSTCSIEPAENQQQTQWIRQWHPFALVKEESQLPIGQPGDAAAAYRDGGYFAILRRNKK